jgi:RNA polymerase sigma-70 factor (ECF subfamily)
MSEIDPQDLDRRCLRRLAEGDIGALETIWKAHGDRSFRHALWVTGRREDAEDVVQTVFLRLVGLGGELLGVRNLVSYLGTMIHHEAVSVSKRRVVRDGHVEPDPDALLAEHPDPEQDVDRRRVAALVATLPADQREVVVLHLWEGLTFREIGRVTGVSLFTVASRYRLATSRLRRALTGEPR